MNIFEVMNLTNENIKLMNQNILNLNDAMIAVNNAAPYYVRACEENKMANDIIERAIK